MKADTLTLSTIFGKDVRYIVPLYQRPYVWEHDRHWEPLVEDVISVVDAQLHVSTNGGAGAVAPHFMGAIVLEQLDTPSASFEERSIIDGQQRLTTLQLFISAASRLAAEAGADGEARVLGKLVRNDPDLVTFPEHGLKVWPTNANREAFRAVMQPGGPDPDKPDDPNNLIEEAYAYFVRALAEWLADDSDNGATPEQRLTTLRNVVRERIKLVVIDLERDDNAQIIFETLNARGTPLLAVDLVKNLVFQRAEAANVDLEAMYEGQWAPFDQAYWRKDVRQGRLTRARAELFLMHWLTMQLADEVKVHQLFTKFRALLDAPGAPSIAEVVKEFASDAEVFASFESQPEGSVEQKFFSRLATLDTTTPFPLALYLMRQPDHRLPIERRHRVLRMIESWLVRRMVCRLTAKNYNRYFIDLLQAVRSDTERADEIVREALTTADKDTTVWPTDAQLDEVLLELPIYKRQVTIARTAMLLAAAEEAMRGAHSEDVALPTGLTIEHVMPQTWRPHWPLPTNDPVAEGRRDSHIDRLGNLTLVTHALNSSVSNGPWEKKRAGLNEHSALWLNRRIVDGHPEQWDETTIDARSGELAAYVKQAWPGPSAPHWSEPSVQHSVP